jgi:hypothetical protein
LSAVCKYGVIPHLAIVGQMDISHDPVVVAHAGHTTPARRAQVKGSKLANGVAIANHQLTRLAFVFFILRDGTQ